MTRASMGLVLLIAGSAAASLTIAPQYHNFGKVGVMGLATKTFTTTLPSGVTQGTLTFSITGPNAADFLGAGTLPFSPNNACPSGPQGVVCEWSVEFRPRSMGQKHATLVVSVGPGNWTSATLEGEAVAALCTNRVVFCNYAHHYSGVVSWRGEGGHANVDVVKGVASCNATTGDGAGMTSGSGLIAVEFGKDDEMPAGFYRITVACPIRYPPEPARPAELGHDEFGSYKQPLPSGVTVEQVHAGPPNLKGSISEGGDGVSWNLCPNSQYRLGRPEEDSPDEHRCRP